MRSSLLCLIALLLVAAGQALFYYGQLPVTMASHFDGAGHANDWQSKAAFFCLYWFVILLTVGIFAPMSFLLWRVPTQFINLPHKDYWLAKERREASLNYLASYMEWMAVASLLLLLVVFQTVIVTNLNGATVLPPAPTWLVLGSYFVFVFVCMTKIMRRFRKPA